MSLQEQIAKRVEEKPIPSMVAFQLLKVIEDDDHSLKEVINLVANDASLTAEVLKVSNSATYYRGQPVTTVNRAVQLLGEMMVVGVAICASSSVVFNSPLEGYESVAGEMWEHSLRCAISAREIAKHSKKNMSHGLAFTAGLLHDIGKSVVSEFLVGSSEDMMELCESGAVQDYIEAERKIVGTDHAQVGYSLAKHWRLPDTVCVGIRDHHRPSEAIEEHRPLVYAVHLADLISQLGGSGTGCDSLAYRVDSNYEEYFPLDRDAMALILLKIEEDFNSIKDMLMSDRKV